MNQAINPEGSIIGKTATGLNHLELGREVGRPVFPSLACSRPIRLMAASLVKAILKYRRAGYWTSIKVVLESARSGVDHVVMNQIFLRNLGQLPINSTNCTSPTSRLFCPHVFASSRKWSGLSFWLRLLPPPSFQPDEGGRQRSG